MYEISCDVITAHQVAVAKRYASQHAELSHGTVPGTLLDLIGDEGFLQERFGKDYASSKFDRASLSASINELFSPPSVALGLTFEPFSIREHWEPQFDCNELLSALEVIEERMEFLDEASKLDEFWYSTNLDPSLLARYLPLLAREDGEILFHAPHLYRLLGHIHKSHHFGRLLAWPAGPLADRF
jgi:hypothetical protein